jgi:ElaB/YqjD/DUF883 family membrane-anchored ribosome-binding protein
MRSGFTAGEAYRWPTLDTLEENLRTARRAAVAARHATEDAAAATAVTIRKHPLSAVGVAVAAGVLLGAAAGFCAGWCTRK